MGEGSRLWLSTLDLPHPLDEYLDRHGFPIRYGYVGESWPISYYQTAYATEAGSAEMPSAGRAFTPELITRLVAQGVQFAPLLLHTAWQASRRTNPQRRVLPRPTRDRPPGERRADVGPQGRRGRDDGGAGARDRHGRERHHPPREGWTRLIVTPERGIRAVDSMITGLHEPRSSHLAMLEALAGREHLRAAYGEALREGYLWHEFGDLHLIL